MNATTSQNVSTDEAHREPDDVTPLLLGDLGRGGLGCRRAVSRTAGVRPGAVPQWPVGATAGRKIFGAKALTRVQTPAT